MGGVSRSTKICDGRNVRDDIVTCCHGFVDTVTAMSRVVTGHLLGCHGLSRVVATS